MAKILSFSALAPSAASCQLGLRRLLLAACVWASFSAPASADALQDINKLLKQGQQAQALEQVDKYLAGKPKDAQGRFMKGLILTEMNRTQDAIVVFTKLTEDYPELPEPYNNLAVIYAQQKQFEKAKQALEMAIRTHPSYATAHENLGDIYARLASQAYDKALQLDSSNSSAQTKLSMIRDLMGASGRPVKGGKTQLAAATPTPTPVVEPKPVVEAPKPVVVAPPPVKPVEVAKPAEPKATEVKAAEVKTEKPVGDASADVTRAIEGWARAWSKKDVKGYLAFYAKDFKTPGGESRSAWESERQKRINKPGTINVSVEGVHVTMDAADKATAKFRQHYRAASMKTSASKIVVMVKRDGKWQIQQEKVGN
jgi:tetratricopeptide (TPR) repeat protein